MKKNRPLYAALLTALLIISAATASLTASAVSVSEILETTYSIDQILFGDDEINGFTFVYYDKADNTVKNMVYLPIGESPWNPSLDMYTGPTAEGECEGYEYMILNYTFGVPTIHPSLMGSTGCAFTAPYTGTVKIMTYFRVGSVLPDSSELFIYKNSVSDDNLLFRQVGGEDPATAEYELTVDVNAGDMIYWFVDCMDSNANDACDFNPRVVYTAVNDENIDDNGNDTDDEPSDSSSSADEPPVSSAPDTGSSADEPPASSAPATGSSAGTAVASGAVTGEASDTPRSVGSVAIIVIVVAAVTAVTAAVLILVAKKRKK